MLGSMCGGWLLGANAVRAARVGMWKGQGVTAGRQERSHPDLRAIGLSRSPISAFSSLAPDVQLYIWALREHLMVT